MTSSLRFSSYIQALETPFPKFKDAGIEKLMFQSMDSMQPKRAVVGEMVAGSHMVKPAVFHSSICNAPSLPKVRDSAHWQHRHCPSVCRSYELPEAIILVCATRSPTDWGPGTTVQAQVVYKTQRARTRSQLHCTVRCTAVALG